jgi:hypothetical protein
MNFIKFLILFFCFFVLGFGQLSAYTVSDGACAGEVESTKHKSFGDVGKSYREDPVIKDAAKQTTEINFKKNLSSIVGMEAGAEGRVSGVLGNNSSVLGNNSTGGYQPLSGSGGPIGGLAQSGGGGDGLQNMILGIFTWGVSIAGLLAIIYIVIGGVQYMTTDSIFNKEDGKNKIQSAVVGLLIVLAGWLILNEINPSILTGKKLELKKVTIEAEPINRGGNLDSRVEGGGGEDGGETGSVGEVGDIVPIPQGINVKEGAGRNINSAIVNKVVSLNNNLKEQGISWRVTEGYPPTVTHVADCHKNGTCIDANFTGGTSATAANINKFISAANSSGLRAVYEVRTQAEKDALVSSGVPSDNVLAYSGISAPHFSVYNSNR